MRRLGQLGFLTAVLSVVACSTAKKHDAKMPVLSDLFGKKIALVTIEGEDTAKRIVQVALVNQLVQRGTFVLVSKHEVEEARAAPDQDPNDVPGIARRAGAEYALEAKVLKMEAPVREGYSTEEIVDTQLAEEQGTDGKTQRVFKVKSMEGDVQVGLKFTSISDRTSQTAVAEAHEKVEADSRTSSIHLPPKLRFLENLTNQAFHQFFDQFH